MDTLVLSISNINPNPRNARAKREYTKAELKDLITSIREHGLLQPLVVTPVDDTYTVLAGHRRLAAMKALKATRVPCVVLDEQGGGAGLAVLLTDNAQHRAVDPILEAGTVESLVESLKDQRQPHDRAAAMLGKSVAWIRARMRLTTLSPSWCKAFANPEHPISQFPVGHLELIAAVSESVQESAFQDWSGWWDEGVPLREEIKRMVAELTCDLAEVPWDTDATDLLPGAPACAACPKRDSVQGSLFASVGGVRQAKGDRCLDATCFEAKRRAVIYGVIDMAREKHGDKLRVEVPWAYRDIPMPDNLKVHREHELTPLTKVKGGMPVLRLSKMKVAYMGMASRSANGTTGAGARPIQANGEAKPKSLEERRRGLTKRRLVRALDLLITYILVYGTGPSVDPDGDRYDAYVTDNAKELDALAKEPSSKVKAPALITRIRLWNRVREPLARSLRTFGGVSLAGAQRLADTANSVCRRSGMDWSSQFVGPATDAIPEPASWAKLNEDGTPKRKRATN